MRTALLLLLITLSEATIGVFVKLTEGLIPIQTLNFYALACAAAFLTVAMPLATGRPPRFPRGNLTDTMIIGALNRVACGMTSLPETSKLTARKNRMPPTRMAGMKVVATITMPSPQYHCRRTRQSSIPARPCRGRRTPPSRSS